jgi:hypothetical protein
VRLTVGAFASGGRRRPFKARNVSALRARRASSPVRHQGFVPGAGRGQAQRLRALGIRLAARHRLFRSAVGAGKRQGVSEVGQVGVNPKRRNGRRGGCRKPPRGASDPWAVTTQLVASRKSDTTHRAVACHRVQNGGVSADRGRAWESIQLQKSMDGTWPGRSGE